MNRFIPILPFLATVITALSNDYDNQWLMECKATSEQDLLSINTLADSEHMDIWNEHPTLHTKIAIRVDEVGRGGGGGIATGLPKYSSHGNSRYSNSAIGNEANENNHSLCHWGCLL